jgi:hypothetical protein
MNSRVCELAIVVELTVVNPITNPNPVYSHTREHIYRTEK